MSEVLELQSAAACANCAAPALIIAVATIALPLMFGNSRGTP